MWPHPDAGVKGEQVHYLIPYSPSCLEKLSEKGYEQHSDHEFGWYLEGEMDQIEPFGGP
jgi:hypothetical protein